MKHYRFGFSPYGLLAVALVMLPNLLYVFAAPPNDVLAGNAASFALWNVLENIGRFALMAVLAFVRPTRTTRRKALPAVLALCALAAYYVLWALYFAGAVHSLLLLGLAVFPVLFFLGAALWIPNLPAFIPLALFGAVHIVITTANYLQ